MENRKLVLSLLILVVTASGCFGNGGEETSSEGKGSITVQNLNVQPNQIYGGSEVNVGMDLVNTGKLPARLTLGSDGGTIFKNYCPDIFEMKDFRAISALGNDKQNYVLEPKQSVKLRWELQQEGRVPLYGKKCDMRFEVPFNYTVSAYKQVQVKRNRDVEASDLVSESSAGPLLLAIETIGSTAEEGQSTFVSGDDENVTVLLQLQNGEREEYNKGVVDIAEKSLTISADSPLELDEGFVKDVNNQCSGNVMSPGCITHDVIWKPLPGAGYSDKRCDLDKDEKLRIFEGKSRVISCEIPVPDSMSKPSVISEIEASVNYTYVKDVGTRSVEVEYSGDN